MNEPDLMKTAHLELDSFPKHLTEVKGLKKQ